MPDKEDDLDTEQEVLETIAERALQAYENDPEVREMVRRQAEAMHGELWAESGGLWRRIRALLFKKKLR